MVDGDRVYTLGVEGRLRAHSAADGELLWQVDTTAEFGVVQNFFGVGSTPRVEGDLLIAQIGGSPPGSPKIHSGEVKGNGSGLVAFDKGTGEVRYSVTDTLASYASPTLATIGGRRWGFAFTRGGLLGFARRMQRPSVSKTSDWRKGGGFEYVGAIMPIELFPQAYRKGLEIAERHGVACATGARIIGLGHCMMFFYGYAFNRAEPSDVKLAQAALEDTNATVLELGGIPWKAEASAQKQIMERMDPNTLSLMNRLREALDPRGIMNPGNWEMD